MEEPVHFPMIMMYCIPPFYRQNGLFQLNALSAQWNSSRSRVAAKLLGSYIREGRNM